jgi:ParD-like antitoxin of type II bacterial toxin-antitoxin system
MGIVRLSDEIHNQLRKASKVFDRSLNAQAEHWIKMGMLSEFYPNKDYEELRKLLFLHESLSIEKILGGKGK